MITRPRHIMRSELHPVTGARDRITPVSVGPFPHEVRLIIDIDARGYPLRDHCRYVRWREPAGPATFANLVFATGDPGMRVGPWPGWRDIPPFPPIAVTWGTESAAAEVHWWGDELERGFLRALVWFPAGCKGAIRCTPGDARLHAVTLEVVEDARVRPEPGDTQLLPALRGVHPRLLFTPDDLAALRSRAHTHHAHYDIIRSLLAAPALPAETTPESKTLPGPERPRPEDRAMLAALDALVDPSPGSVRAALLAIQAFVDETRRPAYEPWGIDTQSGEMLFLLCLLYDWMQDRMDATMRADMRAWLWTAVGHVRRHLSPGRTDLAQAHYLGCGLGLLAFACVFYEEHPEAPAWLNECSGAFDAIMMMLPADGAHPHGTNLWIYEYGFLLRWVEVLRVCTGVDHWPSPHWQHASAFRAATMSPDGLCGVTFGDPQYRVGGDAWCHYLIAARTGSGRAQATGDALVDGNHEGIDFRSVPPRRRVYEFLFHDPAVVPDIHPPGVEHFADTGQITVRTGKKRDGLFTFKAGPPIGATRYAAGERGGYGHADPCNGSFLWYVEGAFLVSGPGPVYRRDTSLHNCITVNGAGQIGDGTVWMPDYIPPSALAHHPSVVMDGGAVSLTVDLAHAYLPHLGVRRCFRAMYIDAAHERIVGIDLVRCHARSRIDWHLHSRAPFAMTTAAGVSMARAVGTSRAMTAYLLEPSTENIETAPSVCVPAYPHDGARDHALRWSVEASAVRFVWFLTLAPEPSPPALRCFGGVVDMVFPDGTRLYFDGSRMGAGGHR